MRFQTTENYCLEKAMKAKKLLQLYELPAKQWIALEGVDLAKAGSGFYTERLDVTISCVEHPAIDEVLLFEKLRKFLKTLNNAGSGAPRMVAIMWLRFTVPASIPTVWEISVVVDVPNAVPTKHFEKQVENCFAPYKPFSCAAASWTSEVSILLNRTFVPPSLHSSILAREFVCISEEVKHSNDELMEVENNRRRMRTSGF
jgi:hypothetical protein